MKKVKFRWIKDLNMEGKTKLLGKHLNDFEVGKDSFNNSNVIAILNIVVIMCQALFYMLNT